MGAAQVNNEIYLVGALGSIYRLGDFPDEGMQIAYEKVLDNTLPYYGATSAQDAGVVKSIGLDKAIADEAESYHPGDTITFTFDVQNTGNTPVTNVSIAESEFTGTGSISAIAPDSVAVLQPGEVAQFKADYVVTEEDLEAGAITNTATARATDRDGQELVSEPSMATASITPKPTPEPDPTETPKPTPEKTPTAAPQPPSQPVSLAKTGAPLGLLCAVGIGSVGAGVAMRRGARD